MVFKQSFKYLKNEKINFIKGILKLEYLFYQNTQILFHLILYSYFISTQTNDFPKKNLPNICFLQNRPVNNLKPSGMHN